MRFLSNLVASALGTLLALGLTVMLFFFVIFAITASADTTPSVDDGSILVVELAGPLPERTPENPFAGLFGEEAAYSLRGVKGALEKAAFDDRIAGVWLKFQGLRAQWATLEELRASLVEFQKVTDKPLIASSGDYSMAESAYFVATAADGVYASREAFFAFNGFALTQAFFAETLDMLHIDPQVIRVGRYKSAVEPFIRNDLSPASEEQLTALLQSVNGRFMTTVAEAREIPVERLRYLASEEAILTADDAFATGLLDGLRYRDEVAALFRERLDAYEAGEPLETVSLGTYARAANSFDTTELTEADSVVVVLSEDASDAAVAEAADTDGVDTVLTTGGEIALVYAVGPIVSGEREVNPFSNQRRIAAESFVETLREVRRDDDIDALVIRINSPGGSAAASDAIWRAVQLIAEEMPVVVSMGDVAASGGYWIATAADAIVADPLTITGSIGVFGVLFDASGFFNDKLGITFDGVQTSPYADLFSAVEPLSPAERQLFEHAIEDTYQTFLEKVAAGREELTVEEVDAIAQGRVWSGEDALRVGLVDALGGLEDAIRIAARAAGIKGYDTEVYPRPAPFFERLTNDLFFQVRQGWIGLSTSALERRFVQQRRRLRRLARTHGTAQARLPFDLTIE